MRKIIFYIFLLGILAACGETNTSPQKQDEQVSSQQQQTAQQPTSTINQDGIYGYYVGIFDAVEFKENKKPSYSNKINISINKIQGNHVEGHSVVAGNIRPFTGTAIQKGDSYTIEAKEPGDDKYDGVFSFTLDTKKEMITGVWVANDKKLSVTKRKYELNKMIFQYDKNIALEAQIAYTDFYGTLNEDEGTFEAPTEKVLKINASSTLLTSKDIENLFQGDLEVIRNAIYARHGYSFQNRRMRYLFDNINWYIPVSTNVTADLTEIEKKNIDLLKRYEKHAAKYYDSYGR